MRTVNFRDDVLWAIAYKLGYDPETNLQKNQAYAYGTYINSWVRRLWDTFDWSDLTTTHQFAPDSHHIVPWHAVALDLHAPSSTVGTEVDLSRIFKVYLLDPRTTWAPAETPFRLSDKGIHCGFEHGHSVWIKYLPFCPQFTAREWNNGTTYNLNGLTYSPSSGECYRSKSSNNLGHDPSQSGSTGGSPQALLVEETSGTPDNPGLPAATQIVDVFAATTVDFTIPDPPAVSSSATITVRSATGTMLGTATHVATGTQSLLTIFTDLAAQLTAALSGFTVTLNPTPLSIRIVNASGFSVTAVLATSFLTAYPLKVVQAQAYVPATAPVAGTGQQLRLSITEEQVIPGGTYLATFTTVDNMEHVAAYTALSTDSAQQVLSGLIDSVIAMQGADPFFAGVSSTLDTVSPSATFTIAPTLGAVSLHPVLEPPGSVFWELVPFPFALVDQVIRGVIADARGEQGQTDKQAAEEQVVPSETKLRVGAQTGNEYDPLSDQQRPHSRYSVK